MKSDYLPTLFKNKPKSYLIIITFGIFAGLLVAFFSDFPNDTLWAFSFFSSATIGFWMFTTSSIVLCSEKHLSATINAALYVYFMFFVTMVFKDIRLYNQGYSGCENILELIMNNWLSCLLYGLLPAIVCGGLGFILWFTRRNKWYGKILVYIPLIVISFEMIFMYISVFTTHTKLFMALVDSACVVAYIGIFKTALFSKLN